MITKTMQRPFFHHSHCRCDDYMMMDGMVVAVTMTGLVRGNIADGTIFSPRRLLGSKRSCDDKGSLSLPRYRLEVCNQSELLVSSRHWSFPPT